MRKDFAKRRISLATNSDLVEINFVLNDKKNCKLILTYR